MNRWIRQWDRLGAIDPYWAVLTDPNKKGGLWSHDEFFATGEFEISNLFNDLQKLGITFNTSTALDFGCGVGRLSRALSSRFIEVIGVDISSSMLKEATATNEHLPNIKFLRIDGSTLSQLADNSIDFVYSNISLQHSPRRIQIAAIQEFLRVLKPRGIAVFHAPTFERKNLISLLHRILPTRILNLGRIILHGYNRVMEMHPLDQRDVKRILVANRAKLLHQERSPCAGDAFISYRYIIRKAPNKAH